MPQPYPAVPTSLPMLRRALVLACTGLVLSAASAFGATGGAEAGDPAAAQPVPAPAAAPAPGTAPTPGVAPAPAAVSAAPSRAVIRSIQRRLRLKADGVYGPRTRAAVRRFQRRSGLAADGRLSPETLAALGVKGRAASVSPAPAPSPEAARLLAAIAQCESGGDPTKVSADGQYRGKYQFLVSTWESTGGTGDPAAAPEAEQDQRAAALLAAEGTKPWPVCGRKAQAAN